MGMGSIWHWLIVVAIIAILFGGRGKISGVMGDFAKGIKAFKSGMKDEENPDIVTPSQVTQQPNGVSASNVSVEPIQKSG